MFIECSWCKFWSVALTCKHASVPYWAPPGLQGDRLNCTYISLIPSGHLLTSSRTPSSNRWNSPVEKHSAQMLPQCIPRGHFSLSLSSSLLSLFYMITKNWTHVFPEWLNRTWDTIPILLTRPALKLCASFLWRRWWHVHRRRNGSSVHYWTCKICSTSFFVTIWSELIPLRWHVLISMCATRWLRNLVILRNIDAELVTVSGWVGLTTGPKAAYQDHHVQHKWPDVDQAQLACPPTRATYCPLVVHLHCVEHYGTGGHTWQPEHWPSNNSVWKRDIMPIITL